MIKFFNAHFKKQHHCNISWLGGHSQGQWNHKSSSTGLIDEVIKLSGLEAEFNEPLIPVDKILQGLDGCNEPRQHQWSYQQVIGILNYIVASLCPDITFAVCQCAFSDNSSGITS
jgi:hypothetical protein